MARRRRERGFVSDVVLPLAGGTAITLVAIVAFALWAGVPVIAPGGPADSTGAVATARIERTLPETVAPPDRNVTPEGVTPGPAVDGRLRRAAPDPRTAPTRREPETLFRRVVVLDGAHFRTIRDKRPVLVRIAGIEAPAFRETCTDAEGREWKCGARARAELARLILNRSVSCVMVDEGDPAAPVGRCRVGVYDLAEWMVEGGWADPAEDAPAALIETGERARETGRGRYGPAPLGVVAG